MDKLVSVIVPVYNVEKYLDRCLRSITQQTYKNVQIILIEDGTMDKSGIMCDEWKEKDSRIVVIHQANGGLSNARNTGLDAAAGEYLTFVDSDDVIAANMIEELVRLIEDEAADIAMCGVCHIFDEHNIKFENKNREIKSFDRVSAINEMWYQKSFLPSAWGKLYKRDKFEKIRFTEKILFEDIDLMHEVFWKSKKIVYKDMQLYGYVHRENSITTTKFSEKDCIILDISDKLMRFAEDNDLSLLFAAQSYAVTAAFRIYLNAPHEDEKFAQYIIKAKDILGQYGKDAIKNSRVRKKTKYALILYFYFKPFLKYVYKHKKRWK